jgi:hypothetical protein
LPRGVIPTGTEKIAMLRARWRPARETAAAASPAREAGP